MKWFVAAAAHKPCALPDDPLYTPVEVGAALREEHLALPDGSPMRRDDETADNISARNLSWCELTAHYAMLRGIDADAYGLCHYRRYFALRRTGPRMARAVTRGEAERLMDGADCVLPKKRHYWIQSSYDQYAHAHHERDLLTVRQVLLERSPKEAEAFDRVQRRRSGHRFNMFLMRREVFVSYSEWLFAVLTETEKRLDISDYSAQDRRVFGYLGERLLDVWLALHPVRVRECRVVNLEPQHWPRKIAAFLLRAIRPKRD